MPGFILPKPGGGTLGGHLSRVGGRTEYYRSYNWEIENLFDDYFYGSSILVNLRDATLPIFTVDRERVKGASLEYKFAKGVSFEDVRVTWYDTLGLLDIIKRWRESVWTEEDGIKTAFEHKRNSILTSYLPDASGAQQWMLVNSWPAVIRHGDLTYTNSDFKIVEVTVAYDWAREMPVGSSRTPPSLSTRSPGRTSTDPTTPPTSPGTTPVTPPGLIGGGF